MTSKVVLRNTRDEKGSRYLDACLQDDGSLVIHGQDLGKGVEDFYGEREYEWAWTVAPEHVPAVAEALQTAQATLLDAIAERFAGDSASGLDGFLKGLGIPVDFWSRVGD